MVLLLLFNYVQLVKCDYESTLNSIDQAMVDLCMNSLNPCTFPDTNCDDELYDFAMSLQITINQMLTVFDQNYLDGQGTFQIYQGGQTGNLKPTSSSVNNANDYINSILIEYMKSQYDGGTSSHASDTNTWFQFGSSIPNLFHGIALRGRTILYSFEMITSFSISYTLDGISYTNYNEGQIFIGSQIGTKINYIELTPFVARAIRIIPVASGKQGTRADVYISKHVYKNILPDDSLIAAISCGFNVDVSGTYGVGYEEIKIGIGYFSSGGGSASWCTGNLDTNQWVGVSGSVPMKWKIISIQGSNNLANWVTSFKVTYTIDGLNWLSYMNGAVLTGNTDQNTVVNATLTPFTALGIRVNPYTWNGDLICMRLEVYCSEVGGYWS